MHQRFGKDLSRDLKSNSVMPCRNNERELSGRGRGTHTQEPQLRRRGGRKGPLRGDHRALRVAAQISTTAVDFARCYVSLSTKTHTTTKFRPKTQNSSGKRRQLTAHTAPPASKQIDSKNTRKDTTRIFHQIHRQNKEVAALNSKKTENSKTL